MADNDEVVLFLGLGAFVTFLIGFFSVFNAGANPFGVGFVLLSVVLLFSAIQVSRTGSVKQSRRPATQSPIPASRQEPAALSYQQQPPEAKDSPHAWPSEPITVEVVAPTSEPPRWSPPPWQASQDPQQPPASETEHGAVESQ